MTAVATPDAARLVFAAVAGLILLLILIIKFKVHAMISILIGAVGIGLMAEMAFTPDNDRGLQLIEAAHLFEPSWTYIALRPDTYLRGYTYDFINMFSLKLTRERIDQMLYMPIMEDFSI